MLKKIISIIFITLFLLGTFAFADEVSNLDEAKALSAKTNKPILLEFVRSD